MPETANITAILQGITPGDRSGIEQILPAVYDELRVLAARHLRNERRNHTLQATALVNEAYLKLMRRDSVPWRDRIHFFGAAGQAIRRILVDHARGRKRRKRTGHRVHVDLQNVSIHSDEDAQDIIALDDALNKLFAQAPRKAQVVELRYFSGLTAEDSAAILGVTTRTVERDWQYARAWLFRELGRDSKNERGSLDQE